MPIRAGEDRFGAVSQVSRARRGNPTWAFVLLGGAAIGIVTAFDLGTALPLNDEWQYRWPIERLAAGHGFHLYPAVLATSLVQLVAAAPAALLHLDPRVFRLTVIPFAVLAAVASWLLSRRLGADHFWAGVAAVAIPAGPLTLIVATGFESDIAYLGLLLAAAFAAVLWIDDGRARLWCIALTTLAALQRQHAVAIPAAMTLVMLLEPRLRARLRREVVWLAGLWTAVGLAIVFPYIFGIASELERQTLSGRLTSNSAKLVGVISTLIWLGPMMGLLLLPFLIGLLPRPPAEPRAAGRLQLLPMALAMIGVITAGFYTLVYGNAIWPGDVFGVWGLGPLHLGGAKPPFFALPVFVFVELLTVTTLVVILVWRRGAWTAPAMGGPGLFLVLLAVAQLGPIGLTTAIDRYYIPVAAVVAPVLASLASRSQLERVRWWFPGRAWAVATIVASLFVYAAAEQDYQAWQQAREASASVAYRLADPHRVEAGFEAVGVHAQEPDLSRSGRTDIDLAHVHAYNPVLSLVFAPPRDPRPGVGYSSLAPGKIVIVCSGAQVGCPLTAPH